MPKLKTIAILLIVLICGILAQTYPTATIESNVIDAEIILPTEIPSKLFTNAIEIEIKPKQISNLEILQNFLVNDTTDHHEYIPSGENMYICVNYATDLAQNLTNAGYNSGIVVRSAKWHNKGCGHLLTWAEIGDDLFVIESGNDAIYWSDDFNATIDTEIYVMRYESLESGHRKCNEMYKWR